MILSLFICLTMLPAVPAAADTAEAPETTDFYENITDVADVTEPTDYPLTVGEKDGDYWLVFSTKKTSRKRCTLTLKFKKTAKLTFEYALQGVSSSGLEVKNGSKVIYNYSSYSGEHTSINGNKSGTAEVEANEGDTVTISFYSGSYSGDFMMYVRELKASLPHNVTFHAENGTDATQTQGIFGTADLKANPFTYEGHIFKGWAETAGGEVKYADQAEYTIGDADTDLYAVWAGVYPLTFYVDPADAELKLFADEEHKTAIDPDEKGKTVYTLENETYYYTADKFGYGSISGSSEVKDAAVSMDVTLRSNAIQTVTFRYEGDKTDVEKPVLTVKTGDRTMSAEPDDSMKFQLPVGYKYEYTFKCSNYSKQSGTIDLTDETDASEKTVTLPMKAKTAWEGADDITEPEVKDGVYQIGTGANLAWLAQKVNDGTGASYHAVLTKDIDLGGESWTPIGKKAGYYSSNAYKGTFDGNGKTIQGLHVDSGEAAVGLFGIVDGAAIKDLTVKGDVKTSSTSSSSAGAGGIAGTVSGNAAIKNCVNYVSVSGGTGAGGIVGSSTGSNGGSIIDSCVNYGAVAGNNSVAGIIGNIDGGITVSNSYNRADVTAKVSKAGGIAGYIHNSAGKIENCYTTGLAAGGSDVYPAIGKKSSGSVDNVYYIDTLGTDSNAAPITEENLKKMAFDPEIPAFVKDMDPPVNDGYPILDFQDTTPRSAVTFTLSPEETVLTVKDADGFKMAGKKDGDKVAYKLKNGKYSYTASAFGKNEAKGEFEVKDASLDKALTLEDAPSAKVRFNITYSDGAADVRPAITVTTDGRTMEAAEDGTYTLHYGYTYDYLVKAKNYKKVKGSVTADDSTKAVIDIKMEYSRSWDGESATAKEDIAGSGTEDDPYQIKSGEDLKWLANWTNSGQVKAGEYYKLMDNVDLGDNPWEPIGKGYSYKFKGVFDGSGKKITGLYVETDKNNYPGLFGNVTGDSSNTAIVKNLRVYGEVNASSAMAAGIVWNAQYAELTGIESHITINDTITGTDGAGGIVGRSCGHVTVAKCGNYGDITAAEADNIGGIIGKGDGSKTVVTECFNTGKITGDEYVGGIVGKYSGTGSNLKNSYNTGSVTGNDRVGGITGSQFSDLSNCYSTGKVTGTTNAAAVVGTHGSSYTPENIYCLDDAEDGSAAKKTAEEFKSLAAELNNNAGAAEGEPVWTQAPERFNSGYPVLAWQKIPADTSKLDAAIAEAEKKSETLTGNRYADIKAELDKAVKEARKAKADDDATDESLAAAEKTLGEAVSKADTGKKAVDDKYAQAEADKKAAEAAAAVDKTNKLVSDSDKAVKQAEADKKAAEDAKKAAETAADADDITPDDAVADQAAASSKLKTAKITKTAYSGKTSVKVTLKKVKGAKNYRIAYKKASAKKYSYKWTKGKTTYTLKGLKAGQKYDIKAAAYTKADGKWIRSKYSSAKRVLTLKLASKKIKASHAKKTVTVKIKKTKGVSGYYITYSAKKSMKSSHVKYFKAKKSGVYKIRKLSKAKYYVQVSPVKTYKGHKYTGQKSAKKTAK